MDPFETGRKQKETHVRKISLIGIMLLVPVAAWADDYPSLPAGPGRDVMVRVCSQCHSPEIASNQRMDHDGWKALVDQMANNGANATDAEFNTITKYLETVFPATPAAKGAGASAVTNDATGTVTPQQ
jgi:mono/diheme cytochrome c family protein